MSASSRPLFSRNGDTAAEGLNSQLTTLIFDSDDGASSFLVRTGQTSAMYIDQFANMGINTTSPGAQLDILSANGSCLRLRNGSSSSAVANLSVGSAGRLTLDASGLSLSSASTVDVATHDGSTKGLSLGGSLVTASASQLNYTVVLPGEASASKALVLSASKSVAGISALSVDTLVGVLDTQDQPRVRSVGELVSLAVAGATTISSSADATSISNGAR